MNLFEAKSIYDSKTGRFLEEFYINSNSVDCDEYYFYLEREKDVEDKKLEYKELVKETVKENPYEYNDDEVCECDECKYKDKKKYESCNDDCKYMNCDECCNDFCDCENDCCEECEGCKVEGFDYGELLEIYTCRVIDAGKDFHLVKEILDEFADIFIPDYEEDEIEITENDDVICENCDCCNCENGELTDEKIEEIKLIEMIANKIENIQCTCGYELRDTLFWLYSTGKSIGWNDHCCFIQKLMDDEENKDYKENKKDKTNFTCNLTVNNTKEDMDKAVEQIFDMINNATRWG